MVKSRMRSRPAGFGILLVVLGLVVVAAILVWSAWTGAQKTTESLPILPAIERPDIPLPNLPEAPRMPDAPIPKPR